MSTPEERLAALGIVLNARGHRGTPRMSVSVSTARERHMLAIQLADGPTGAAQRAAIETVRRDGETMSQAGRRVLLREAGRPDLDVQGPDHAERARLGGLARRST